jgi:Cu(I)/Ag(I) efflux system membrane protein CusA/SilA
MVGGLVTSAFLTLEIIPVISTYWRQEELLWERLATLDAPRLSGLRSATWTLAAGWALLIALGVTAIYVTLPAALAWSLCALGIVAVAAGTLAYFARRRPAYRSVWPESLAR